MQGYNFTERVRKVLEMSRKAAQELRHEYVGTEHILLGILREGEGTAALALQNLGVDSDALEADIQNIVKKGRTPVSYDLPYTSRAKKVLELAMSESREQNHSWVGTEHLLLGILREERGIAAQALLGAGVTLDGAREKVTQILVERGTVPSAEEGTPPVIEEDTPSGTRIQLEFSSMLDLICSSLTEAEMQTLLERRGALEKSVRSVLES